jgi:hypothetical protein
MHKFRHLPPLLRGASLLGVLLALVGIALFLKILIAIFLSAADPHRSADNTLVWMIALTLFPVSQAFDFPSRLYLVHRRRPDRQPFPLDSWQSQVRTFLLVTALPLGTLALAVVIAPTSRAFAGVISLSILEALVLFGASMLIEHRAPAVN